MFTLKGQLEECVEVESRRSLGTWELDSSVESVSVLQRPLGLSGVEPGKRGMRPAMAF